MTGWEGWILGSEDERNKFQELVLCSGEGRAGMREDGGDGLAALQEKIGRSGGCDQGYYNNIAQQEQVHCPRRDQRDGGRSGKMQRPGEKEIAAEKQPVKPAESSRRVERSYLELK